MVLALLFIDYDNAIFGDFSCNDCTLLSVKPHQDLHTRSHKAQHSGVPFTLNAVPCAKAWVFVSLLGHEMFVALNWKFFLVDLTSRKEVAVCLDTNLSLRIVLSLIF